MVNLHSTFQRFNTAISVSGVRLEKLRSSNSALRETITRYFKTQNFVPKFFIQGSAKMGTLILKKDNTYDIDQGVHFPDIPKIEAKTLQAHVRNAAKTQTTSGAQHKAMCVRVIYRGEYNIDLPVYCAQSPGHHTVIATKSGYENSDPKALVEWFQSKKDSKGQMARIVKYLKVWADSRSFKMPSGIALSVWVANHYDPSERDDVALINTLKSIRNSFSKFISWRLPCECPVMPFDDLLSKLDANQKTKVVGALDSLITDGERALSETNEQKAKNLWAKHLGSRFPLV
jgi:hypothetical protein